MRVLSQMLSSDWLNNQVRIIGGAYGGWSVIESSGQVIFCSYRDPNLKETLDNYDAIPDYLRQAQGQRQGNDALHHRHHRRHGYAIDSPGKRQRGTEILS